MTKKGYKQSQEHRRKISEAHKDIRYPNRKRAHIPNRKSPKPFTKAHRKHSSEAVKEWWQKPGVKERMSDIRKNISLETRRKMSKKKWWQGRKK